MEGVWQATNRSGYLLPEHMETLVNTLNFIVLLGRNRVGIAVGFKKGMQPKFIGCAFAVV